VSAHDAALLTFVVAEAQTRKRKKNRNEDSKPLVRTAWSVSSVSENCLRGGKKSKGQGGKGECIKRWSNRWFALKESHCLNEGDRERGRKEKVDKRKGGTIFRRTEVKVSPKVICPGEGVKGKDEEEKHDVCRRVSIPDLGEEEW